MNLILFHVSGEAGMDGCLRITLDDVHGYLILSSQLFSYHSLVN